MGQKVFVTGATGVLGRRLLPRLVGAGHQVTAVERSAQKAQAVRAAGATPVEVDLFDRSAWRINDSLRSVAAPTIAGMYNVAEPDPVRRSAHRDALTSAVGRSQLESVPDPLDGSGANILARSHRISSQHLRDISPWVPTVHCVDHWKELA
jgi:uncharacterized protein YbjT (DUF2867 family)